MILPPDLINTPLPDLTVKLKFAKSMSRVIPFGIVKRELFCTITLPGAVEFEIKEQFDVMFQSPDIGTEHWVVFTDIVPVIQGCTMQK